MSETLKTILEILKDLHEDVDVSGEHPDLVSRMIDIIYKEHIPSELFKVTLPPRM